MPLMALHLALVASVLASAEEKAAAHAYVSSLSRIASRPPPVLRVRQLRTVRRPEGANTKQKGELFI